MLMLCCHAFFFFRCCWCCFSPPSLRHDDAADAMLMAFCWWLIFAWLFFGFDYAVAIFIFDAIFFAAFAAAIRLFRLLMLTLMPPAAIIFFLAIFSLMMLIIFMLMMPWYFFASFDMMMPFWLIFCWCYAFALLFATYAMSAAMFSCCFAAFLRYFSFAFAAFFIAAICRLLIICRCYAMPLMLSADAYALRFRFIFFDYACWWLRADAIDYFAMIYFSSMLITFAIALMPPCWLIRCRLFWLTLFHWLFTINDMLLLYWYFYLLSPFTLPLSFSFDWLIMRHDAADVSLFSLLMLLAAIVHISPAFMITADTLPLLFDCRYFRFLRGACAMMLRLLFYAACWCAAYRYFRCLMPLSWCFLMPPLLLFAYALLCHYHCFDVWCLLIFWCCARLLSLTFSRCRFDAFFSSIFITLFTFSLFISLSSLISLCTDADAALLRHFLISSLLLLSLIFFWLFFWCFRFRWCFAFAMLIDVSLWWYAFTLYDIFFHAASAFFDAIFAIFAAFFHCRHALMLPLLLMPLPDFSASPQHWLRCFIFFFFWFRRQHFIWYFGFLFIFFWLRRFHFR